MNNDKNNTVINESKSDNDSCLDFAAIAGSRYSCRSYDSAKPVDLEVVLGILGSARLAPSACNSQPYHFTVCEGEKAKAVAKAVTGMGLNKFAADAPIMIVISEEPYNKTAAMGAKLKGNDYRSIDIGIAAAFITCDATARGLGSCILGWFDDKKIREICGLKGAVRLVITLGYPKDERKNTVKRKALPELVTMEDKKW